MELRNAYTFVAVAPLSVWIRPLMALANPIIGLPHSLPRDKGGFTDEGSEDESEDYTDDELTDVED